MAVPLQFAALRDDRLDVGFVRPPVTGPLLKHEVPNRSKVLRLFWQFDSPASRDVLWKSRKRSRGLPGVA
jgi:hypothetical protein